jgi:hypothetical protein
MIYILSGLLVMLLIITLVFSGVGRTAGSSPCSHYIHREAFAADRGSQGLSRDETKARLKKLSESPPPKDLKMGAECYKVAMPPDRAEYLCPVCGERTLFVSEKGRNADAAFITRELPDCRRLIKEIKGLDVELDESQFCKKCSPSAKNPSLILIVRYRGQNAPFKCAHIDRDDLVLLREFAEGKDRHRDSYDFETPLKEHIKRLNELLGVK